MTKPRTVIKPRTAVVLAASCFALVGLAACQSGTQGVGAPNPTLSTATTTTPAPTTTTAPPTATLIPTRPTVQTTLPTVPPTRLPVPFPNGTPVPPGQIHSEGMPTPPQTVTVSGDDVEFVAQQSGCEQVTAKATAQTSTSVTIQVITTTITHGTQVCPMYVRDLPIVVRLDAPLGSRELIFQGVTVRP